MYFNQDIKENFINSLKNSSVKHEYKRLFSITRKYEQQINIDLSAIDNQNLYEFFSNDEDSFQPSPIFYSRLNSKIKKYRIWYNNNVALVKISDFDVNVIDFTNLIQKKCFSAERFSQIIKNNKKAGYYNNGYMILLLKFIGLSNKDISQLKDEDIDFLNNNMVVNNKKYNIPPCFTDILKEYRDMKKIYINDHKGFVDKIKSPDFLKKTENKGSPNVNPATVSAYLYNIPSINSQFVKLSGMLYSIKKITEKNISIEDGIDCIFKISPSDKKKTIIVIKNMAQIYKNIYHSI